MTAAQNDPAKSGEMTSRPPWVFHSDGNLMPIMDDLLTLGMNGLHPIQPGVMDLAVLKEKYGRYPLIS